MAERARARLQMLLINVALCFVGLAACAQQQARPAVADGLPSAIPLNLLLGNAKYRNPQLDNDGAYVAYIRPDSSNVVNVFVQQLPQTAQELAALNTSVSLVEQRPAAERQVTFDAKRGVSAYSWAEDDSTIFYLQDIGGDENFHLYMVPVSSLFSSSHGSSSMAAVDLTPYPGVKVQGIITSDQVPRKIYFSMNKRNASVYDLYSFDLDSREVLLHTVNPGDVSSWLVDYQFNLRGVDNYDSTDGSGYIQINDDLPAGGSSSSSNPAVQEEKGARGSGSSSSKAVPVPELFKQAAAGNWTLQQWIAASSSGSDVSKWRTLLRWPFGEDSGVLRFNKAGDALYGTNSVDRDTTELVLWSTAPGAKVLKTFAASKDANVGGVLFNPVTWTPQAVSFNYLRPRWEFFDSTIQAMWAKLQAFQPARDPNVVSRSLDSKRWIISYNADNATTSMYLYTVGSWPPHLLLELQPGLNKYTMAAMHSVVIPAADGLQLPAYLTLPVKPSVPAVLPPCVVGPVPDMKPAIKAAMEASPLKCPLNLNLPLVLYVHGGPWSRDTWGADSVVQFLANRGYAVLQVNFRGSTGYGKEFLNKGNLQWGKGSMQSDLSDAVKWAWDKGIADRSKTCIFGASYGGYATLAGLAFTPELYACGVDLVGVSNIKTFLQGMPSYWKPLRVDFVNRVGDAEANATLNYLLSPVFHVKAIRAPLLMGQGANDPRVPKKESDQMFTAMKNKGLDIEYILYPDEGHGLVRPDNRLDFYSRMEQFLAKHLGGRAEPLLKPAGSTAQVITSV